MYNCRIRHQQIPKTIQKPLLLTISVNSFPDWETFLNSLEIDFSLPVRRVFSVKGVEFFSINELFENCSKELKSKFINISRNKDFSFDVTDGVPFVKQGKRAKITKLFKSSDEPPNEPPQPSGTPLLGNLLDITPHFWPAVRKLHQKYGNIVKLEIREKIIYIVQDPELLEVILSQENKRLPTETAGSTTLGCKGIFVADGLLWKFGRLTFQNYLTEDRIYSLIERFCEKGKSLFRHLKNNQVKLSEPLDVMDMIERLTYDIICDIGFSYNSNMITKEKHEKDDFIQLFDEILHETIRQQTDITMILNPFKGQYSIKLAKLYKQLDEMIADSKESSLNREYVSVLDQLMEARCPHSGREFTQEELRHQIVTLLVAGHKTTTLLLVWSLHYLTEYPNVEEKVINELSEVFGPETRNPTAKDLKKLKYMDLFLQEVLRISCPVQSIQRGIPNSVKAGPFNLKEGALLLVNVRGVHLNPNYWGDDVNEFNPDRFIDTSNHHPFQFIPFGGGKRLCIGNLFALIQVKTMLCLLLRKYHIRGVSGKPTKVEDSNLTTPVGGVWLRFFPRNSLSKPKFEDEQNNLAVNSIAISESVVIGGNKEILVLYGSNYSSTLQIASRFYNKALEGNFKATIKSLNEISINDLVNTSSAVVIFCSTYNGFPPDNATSFFAELSKEVEARKSNSNNNINNNGVNLLSHLNYAVVGVGNSTWSATYQRVPKKINEFLDLLGANQIHPIEMINKADDCERTELVARELILRKLGSSVDDENNFPQSKFISAPKGWMEIEFFSYTKENEIIAKKNTENFLEKFGYKKFQVNSKKELVKNPPNDDPFRSVTHIDFEMPIGVSYQPGDHLLVYPQNSKESVRRISRSLNVDLKQIFTITSKIENPRRISWGLNHLLYMKDALRHYLEINTIPTQETISVIAQYANDENEKQILLNFTDTSNEGILRYKNRFVNQRITFVDILEEFPSINLPFERFMEICPTMHPKLYSISSNNSDRRMCSITVGLVKYEIERENGNKVIIGGISSSFLHSINEGNFINAKIKEVQHMRVPPPNIPFACVCGGTGIAPFIGFIQKREEELSIDPTSAKCLLYFGCRGIYDHLYSSQAEEWEKKGVISVSKTAYSRQEGVIKTYIQDPFLDSFDQIKDLIDRNGVIFMCGSARLANDVVSVIRKNLGDDFYEKLLDEGRIVTDVWG